MTDELLDLMQVHADSLAARLYNLLNELQVARDGIKVDGSFPLESLFQQIALVEASAGWITQLADKLEDVSEGREEVIV